MTIEIQDPEVERIIEEKLASGRFGSVGELIHHAVTSMRAPGERPVPVNHAELLPTFEERAAAFRRWAESHEHGIVLPDEAMTRASFYEDRT